RRPRPVLAEEVALVNDVGRGHDPLGGEIDVAAVAGAGLELAVVLVAAKAGGHGRAQGDGVGADAAVAADALATGARHMGGVGKAQVAPRRGGALADRGEPVAHRALSAIVGLGVTAGARVGPGD